MHRGTSLIQSRAGYALERDIDLRAECFAHEDVHRAEVGDVVANAVKSVIQKERDCDAFTPWQQGHSPKEHREILDRQLLLKREEERDADSRRWRVAEFIAVIIGLVLIVAAAFIERSGITLLSLTTRRPRR